MRKEPSLPGGVSFDMRVLMVGGDDDDDDDVNDTSQNNMQQSGANLDEMLRHIVTATDHERRPRYVF